MKQIFSLSRIRSGALSLGIAFSLLSQGAAPGLARAQGANLPNADSAFATMLAGCPMFPPNNIWNTPVNTLPVHSRSNQWVDSIGRNTGFHMDFGSGTWAGGPIGIPFNIVGSGVPRVPVSFDYDDESDSGPYPIPSNPLTEYGSDHHILIVDSSTCTLYELFDASHSVGNWHAGSGAIWDLNSNALRPDTWTSADAAGLPILPGLVRYDEILSGAINHAIRFTAQNTNRYIWPARHLTSDNNTPQIPPMGARFRLKASFDISGYPAEMQIILTAMKTYGIILADNGSNWYVSGAPDPGWDNDMLHLLDDITGNDFEAVDESGLMVNSNSAAAGLPAISGNVGAGEITLSYVDGAAKTVTSQADGSYSLPVSYNWSGTVTPSHACYTFNPPNLSYSTVTVNQVAQNFAAIFNPASGCANIHTEVGGALMGQSGVPPQKSTRTSYDNLDSGPVKIFSTNGLPIIASMRINLKSMTTYSSYTEFMGLPASKLTDTYIFPWYNNATLGGVSSQLRFANVGNATTTVTIKIGGVTQAQTFTLGPNESARPTFDNVDAGPVEVKSSGGVPIIASLRINLKKSVPGYSSYSEFMGVSASATAGTKYIFPWYNNATTGGLQTQLRFGNVGNATTTVTIKIGGVTQVDTYTLAPNESARPTFTNVDAGPVEVTSSGGVPIIASMRVNLKTNPTYSSYSEFMGLPGATLTETHYFFPWYNNATAGGLQSQLRFANVGNATTTVTIKIGGVTQPDTYILDPNESARPVFTNVDAGPVEVFSSGGVPIIASMRVNLKTNGFYSSYSEFMGMSVGAPFGMPGNDLSTTYWFPWYNNADAGGLQSQLRFGVP